MAKLLTVKLDEKKREKFKQAAQFKGKTMTDLITDFIDTEIEEFEEKFLIPCKKCRVAWTIRELNENNWICSKCKSKVRMLGASK